MAAPKADRQRRGIVRHRADFPRQYAALENAVDGFSA